MLQPKVRRTLASAALVSTLSLLSAGTLSAAPRERRVREGREAHQVTVRPLAFWDLLARVLAKASVRIDPDGRAVSAQAEPRGDASVRIDPDGRH